MTIQTNGDELERHYRCDRCAMKKPPDRYREGQPWWHKWCIRCEASPVGQFPIPEKDEHRRQPHEQRNPPQTKASAC